MPDAEIKRKAFEDTTPPAQIKSVRHEDDRHRVNGEDGKDYQTGDLGEDQEQSWHSLQDKCQGKDQGEDQGLDADNVENQRPKREAGGETEMEQVRYQDQDQLGVQLDQEWKDCEQETKQEEDKIEEERMKRIPFPDKVRARSAVLFWHVTLTA